MAIARSINRGVKRLGYHAQNFARRAGTAADKALGHAHQFASKLDEKVITDLVGPATGKVLGHTKRALASYEDLRTHIMGVRD